MKVLLCLMFVFLGLSLKAQGNLQFNQALLLSTSQGTSVLLGTVPAGKVWKIEGFGTDADGGLTVCDFSYNGSNVAFRAGTVNHYNGSHSHIMEAKGTWLPAGTTLYSLGCNYYRWVSVVEFNIVP